MYERFFVVFFAIPIVLIIVSPALFIHLLLRWLKPIGVVKNIIIPIFLSTALTWLFFTRVIAGISLQYLFQNNRFYAFGLDLQALETYRRVVLNALWINQMLPPKYHSTCHVETIDLCEKIFLTNAFDKSGIGFLFAISFTLVAFSFACWQFYWAR